MSLQEKTIGRSLCPVRVVYILLALSRIFMDGASALEKDTSPGQERIIGIHVQECKHHISSRLSLTWES